MPLVLSTFTVHAGPRGEEVMFQNSWGYKYDVLDRIDSTKVTLFLFTMF